MSKRKAVERATEVRNAMIAGMWANGNYDDGKGTRQKALEEIQNNYDDTIQKIYNGFKEPDLSQDPFFAAIKVPGEELLDSDSKPIVPDRTSEDNSEYEGVDQI